MNLLKAQQTIAREHVNQRIFVEGIAGTGKTTAAIERVKALVRSGVPAETILILVPQMALAVPYREALSRSRIVGGATIQTATLGKLAFEMVDLYWPLIADEVGFENPLQRPHFLSLELVQYYMTRFVEPTIMRQDLFNSVHISRNRLYTQIVDNLNKAVLVDFDVETIGDRLKDAWGGAAEQRYIYEDAQHCASLFREMCRQHNLLDFSLQVSLFLDVLWQHHEPARNFLIQKYRHLIVDNIEEDTPAMHDLLGVWLPQVESALLLYDSEAGYRRFLGADPINAYTLKDACEVHIALDNHRVMSDEIVAFQDEIAISLNQNDARSETTTGMLARNAIVYPDLSKNENTYHPQMLDWAAQNIAGLVHGEGVPPGEIVVLAPYLPDALRFSLQTRLDELDVPNRSHRPSRALREEPAARTLLTLAKLAHPLWGISASPYDVTYALTASIAGLDLVRARLLTEVLYKQGTLQPFENIQNEALQGRITFDFGGRYDRLQKWLAAYQEESDLPLDAFFSRLFGEILSQRDFGFYDNYDAANTAANLIDSARSFRQTVSKIEPMRDDLAAEYVKMVDSGVIANLYVRDWEMEQRDAVLLAPAHTYLMTNQPVDYQFWLNVGATGWAQRLHQPLTQPYVLSRQWVGGRKWTDTDEYEANQDALFRLVVGLIRRCRKRIYLGFSQFGEQGYEQQGPLLMAIQRMLRRLSKADHA